jgi:hypothetical protein
LAVTLAGCASGVSLRDVEVVGGTEAQRAAVLAEVNAFDLAAGRGRTRVSEIRIRDDFGAGGAYRHWNSRIVLSADLAADEIGRIARHELCHALDDAEGLSEGSAALLDPFTDGPLVGYAADRSAVHRRREVFAHLCEAGPVAARVGSEDCPDLAPDLWSAFGWLEEAVWQGVSPIGHAPAPTTGGAFVDLGIEVDRWLIEGLDNGATIAVWYPSDGAVFTSVVVGLDTGFPAPAGAREPDLVAPDGLPATWGLAGRPHGSADGPGVVVATVEVAGFAPVERVLGWDGAAWDAVDRGCWPEDRSPANLFTTEGRVWSAWTEGTRIVWAPVFP